LEQCQQQQKKTKTNKEKETSWLLYQADYFDMTTTLNFGSQPAKQSGKLEAILDL